VSSWRAIRIVSIALVLATIGLQQGPVAAADAAKVLESLEAAKPDWLPDLAKCPADVMPARETRSDYFKQRCAASLERCVDSCRAGNAGDCYAAALVLQEVRNNPVSEALFLRACSLGIVSGCTNRAAGMDKDNGGGNPCAVQTFEKGCERNDPWACTMIGFYLLRGIGVAKDHGRARQALSKSCRFGDTDQACGYAKSLMREIKD